MSTMSWEMGILVGYHRNITRQSEHTEKSNDREDCRRRQEGNKQERRDVKETNKLLRIVWQEGDMGTLIVKSQAI